MAAVVVFLLATLPPKPASATWAGDPSVPGRTVAGAYHVHSRASDGAGDRADIARAARRSGLQFVIITDHGDGTDLEPPAYLDGVLVIDGVEISSNGGHYVALGMDRAPYPLGGEASAVVEDVSRLHGFGFAAHPDSPKPSLAWTDWTVPIDGLEWMNADSEWRNESRVRLTRVLFDYWFRPAGAMASVLDRPVTTLARWDAMGSRRPLLALAGHDAHGGVGTTAEDGKRTSVGGIPSYEASFRSFTTRVLLPAPPTGEASKDAAAILAAIRGGYAFTTIDALAGPGYFNFSFHGGGGREPVTLEASTPAGARVVVLRNGEEVDRSRPGWNSAPGAYRVEVRLARAPGTPPIPWLVSNAISTLAPLPAPPPTQPGETTPVDLSWHVEKSEGSDGDLAGSERDLSIDFRLRAGAKASQFVALAGDFRGARGSGTVLFVDMSASRPMRVSVQLRYPATGAEQRWARSVYIEQGARQVVLPIDDFLPVDGQGGAAPAIEKARSLIFVVDLVNASPGSSGTFRVANVAIGRLRPLRLAGPGSDVLERGDQVARQ